MYLVYVLQANIVGLTDPVHNCSQFGIVRHGKASCRPVIIEIPLKGYVDTVMLYRTVQHCKCKPALCEAMGVCSCLLLLLANMNSISA
jgi:hypothetical protein